MTPEQMVISRELAAELYRNGVPQDSYWSWCRASVWKDWCLAPSCDVRGVMEAYAAYTTDEMIALLGDRFFDLERDELTGRFHAVDLHLLSRRSRGDTPNEALAHLLLKETLIGRAQEIVHD